jgi:hypothetical protein
VIYALAIAIVAGLALLAVPTGLFLAGRRAFGADKGTRSRLGWSWRPNALGFSLLAIVATLVLSRAFPEILFLPLVIPLFWRFRGRGRRSGRGGPFVWQWRARRGDPPPTNGHSNGHAKDDENAIEGQFRNLDDE